MEVASLASMAAASILGDMIGFRIIFVAGGAITMFGGLLGIWARVISRLAAA